MDGNRFGSVAQLAPVALSVLAPACTTDMSTCEAGTVVTGLGKDSGSNPFGSALQDAGRDCATPPSPVPLVGWASLPGMGVETTTGGNGGEIVRVATLADLNRAAAGAMPAIVIVSDTVTGHVTIGSNKTIIGICGAVINGHVQMNGSVNVIVRNIRITGYNCADSPSDCSAGADAITVERSHHLWFDHDDISDGSDGNLDITHGSDFVTVSWTKFHYSCRRTDPAGASGGHQFSNLIGHSDSNSAEDSGHLNITFHNDWWASNVVERMPRVRFGKVHIFNSLYTAAGDAYCIGVGVNANIRDENNVFLGVKNPIDSKDYSNSVSIIESSGNTDENVTGSTGDVGGVAFTPVYPYAIEPTSAVEAAVKAGIGPR